MLWWKNTKRNNYWKRRPISSQKTRKKLFGKAFHEDWCSDLKTKQKYQQVFRNETKSSYQGVKRPSEGALQRQVEEVVGGQRHKRTLLDQHCASNMVRVLTTHNLKIPQLVNAETLKVHPLIRNLFEIKVQHRLLVGRLKFPLKNSEKST